jgi:hypothetical protein
MKRKLSYKLNKSSLFFGFFILSLIEIKSQNNYPADADAELSLIETKILNTNINDFSLTFANAVFYNPNSKVKTYNFDAECENIELGFMSFDTTYKYIDTAFFNKTAPKWEFMDLTDSTAVIQYIASAKPLVKLTNFLFSHSDTINRNSDFTYSHPSVTADSIVYFLGTDTLTRIRKVVNGSSNSITFSRSELSTLGASNGEAAFLVCIYNMMPVTYNNRKYYFINNSIFSVAFLSIL